MKFTEGKTHCTIVVKMENGKNIPVSISLQELDTLLTQGAAMNDGIYILDHSRVTVSVNRDSFKATSIVPLNRETFRKTIEGSVIRTDFNTDKDDKTSVLVTVSTNEYGEVTIPISPTEVGKLIKFSLDNSLINMWVELTVNYDGEAMEIAGKGADSGVKRF